MRPGMEIGKTVPQGPVKTTLLLDGGQFPLLSFLPTIPPPFSPLLRNTSPPFPLPWLRRAYEQRKAGVRKTNHLARRRENIKE
ncbi:hypothetical protein INR49_001592 [Caranx melampygus]|nr:hypothetical protein INR49_001592 [Caranx melampygus]